MPLLAHLTLLQGGGTNVANTLPRFPSVEGDQGGGLVSKNKFN